MAIALIKSTSTTDLRELLRPHIARVGQTEAARLAGMHRSNVSGWLAGSRQLSIEGQIKLAVALGLEVEVVMRPHTRYHCVDCGGLADEKDGQRCAGCRAKAVEAGLGGRESPIRGDAKHARRTAGLSGSVVSARKSKRRRPRRPGTART